MSVSFKAVLSLWKPMGFMMSLRSVRMLYAIARKQRVTLEYGQAVPYALTDTAFLGGFQPALISSMLWGGCMAFGVLVLACCVCGCKLCHSLFKLYHILSVFRNQSRFSSVSPTAAHPADIPHGLASVRLPQTRDEDFLRECGHIPFSTSGRWR